MTIEEYLRNVKKIYYQVSVIVEGKQLLIDNSCRRLMDIQGSTQVRFVSLSLPATTEVDDVGRDYVVINFGNVRLVIWPVKEEE